MSLTWEEVGETKEGWIYGIITGTGTLSGSIVDNLLNTTEIENKLLYNDDAWVSNGYQFGIKVVGYTTIGEYAFNPINEQRTIYTAIQYLYDVIFDKEDNEDNKLETISYEVLYSGSISSITIPSSVTEINSDAFTGSGINFIYVDTDNQNYSSGKVITDGGYDYNGVLYNKAGTELLIYPYDASMTAIIIPEGVTTISVNAFSSNTRLKKITLASTITTIRSFTFVGTNVESIYVDNNNQNYSSGIVKTDGGNDINGILYNKNGTELIIYPSGLKSETIIIPEDVTTIKQDAFYGNSSLKKVTLASTITTIEGNAFYNCYMLDEVYGLRSSMTIGETDQNGNYENPFQYTGVKEAVDIAKTINDRSQTTDETNRITISYDPSSPESQDTTTQTYDVVTTVTKVSNVVYNFDVNTRPNVTTTVTWTWQETVEALGNRDPTGSVTISGTAEQGSTLTAITSSIEDDDGLGAFSYQWKRNGTAISGATSSTYTLTQEDVGKSITVTVSYTDQRGFDESVTSAATSAVTNVNDPPTGSVTISGTVTQGQELTAVTTGISDFDGIPDDVVFSYQWKRVYNENEDDISGATNSTYTLVQADVGKKIKVKVTYIDEGTYQNDVTSAATDTVANINDPPIGSVTISGTTSEGSTLTAITSSIEDVDGLGAFSYQWKRDGTAINGATSSTYTLTQEDVGKKISVTVSYIDGQGTTESLTSAATDTVANVNDVPTIVYSTDNLNDVTKQDLETNRAQVNVTNYGDAKNDSFTYQWQISEYKPDDNDLVWSPIEGATNAEYTFKDSDANQVFRAIVNFTYSDETSGSKPLSRIDYFPTVWTDESKQNKTVTVGEEFTFSPEGNDDNGDWTYYLLESPDWLDFTPDYTENTDNIPIARSPGEIKGTPTVTGEYTVKIAGGEQVFYRMSVLTFTIKVLPFKPATKIALETAINKWYDLANNVNETTANNHEGPEYFGNPKHWDTSLITDLSYVFFKKDQNTHPEIGDWDVSNVISMQGTFSNSTFNGELNNWNVYSVIDFSFTFANNVVFNKPLFRWNVQDANTMESMFDNAYSFNQTIEPPMMKNKDGTDFPTQLTWDETTISGYLTTIYGSATPQTDPTTFKGVFGMIALLKKTYLDKITDDPNVVGKYNTIKVSFSEVISELITNQQEILKYNYTYDEDEETWKKTSPSIYFANTDGKTGDDLNDAKDKLNQLRLNTIVDGMLLINKAYDIAKGLGADYSDLIEKMKGIYDNVYTELPFYVAWYAPLLETKANFLNNALTFHNGATMDSENVEARIDSKLTIFIDTNPIKSINNKDYDSTDKQKIVKSSSTDLYEKFKNAYTS